VKWWYSWCWLIGHKWWFPSKPPDDRCVTLRTLFHRPRLVQGQAALCICEGPFFCGTVNTTKRGNIAVT